MTDIYNDDDTIGSGSNEHRHGSSSTFGISSSPTTLSSSPSTLSRNNEYISKKRVDDLLLLNEQLNKELREKDDIIKDLREETSKGKLQKKLQVALQDNIDLRHRLDEIKNNNINNNNLIYEKELNIQELESVKLELIKVRQDSENLILNQQLMNEELKDENYILNEKLLAAQRELYEMENDINEYEKIKKSLMNENNILKQDNIALKQGKKYIELEEKYNEILSLLHKQEYENDILLKEINELNNENNNLHIYKKNHIDNNINKLKEDIDRYEKSINEKNNEINYLKLQINDINKRNDQLEKDKLLYDEYIIELKQRMKDYEQGYNLNDSINEIRKLKTIIKKQDNDINHMKDIINQREKQLQLYIVENKNLKKLANVDESYGLNPDELQLDIYIELNKYKAINRQNKLIIEKLENDRLDLLDQLRKNSIERSENGLIYLGLNEQQSKLVEDYIEKLKMGDHNLPYQLDDENMKKSQGI